MLIKSQAAQHHQEHILIRSESRINKEESLRVSTEVEKIQDYMNWAPDKHASDGVYVGGLYFESARWTSDFGKNL